MLSKALLVIPLLENRQPNLECSKDFLNCLSVSLKRTLKEKNLFLERSIVKIKYPQSAFSKKMTCCFSSFREKTRSFSKNYFLELSMPVTKIKSSDSVL